MAGDLKITPIAASFPTESGSDFRERRELFRPRQLDDSFFEKADNSAERRKALADAITTERRTPKGKLVIERDQETGKFVQKMIDPKSGEVLKQWPEEKFIELAKQMGEAYGLLVDRNI